MRYKYKILQENDRFFIKRKPAGFLGLFCDYKLIEDMKPVTINIDADGTLFTHSFPEVGKNIGAVPVLKELVEQGHQLILFTMRSDIVNPQGRIMNSILKVGITLPML